MNEYVLGKPLAPLYAFLGAAPAVVLIGRRSAGLVEPPLQPDRPAADPRRAAWNLGTIVFASSYLPAATEIAALTAYVSYAVGGHILLSYPTGRLREQRDRVLVTLLYVAFGPAIVVCFALPRRLTGRDARSAPPTRS